jgi:hypothetical protein
VDIVWGELPAAVVVGQEVAKDCEQTAERLYGNVPFGPYYLMQVSVWHCCVYTDIGTYAQDHARGEDDAPREHLYQHVCP